MAKKVLIAGSPHNLTAFAKAGLMITPKLDGGTSVYHVDLKGESYQAEFIEMSDLRERVLTEKEIGHEIPLVIMNRKNTEKIQNKELMQTKEIYLRDEVYEFRHIDPPSPIFEKSNEKWYHKFQNQRKKRR